jgi:5-oxopent-3-ene-1,2,5-tricarboxylate decarboxylase / 2-hydroxyhepta-2,4-diene-1,7-dioate isomerase
MTPNTVYGSLMHHRAEIDALAQAASKPPYNALPKAPVLYIKPANTFHAFGGVMPLPAAHARIQARACVGLMYWPKQASAAIDTAQSAIKLIAHDDWKMALLCDFSLPHESFYRPPLRFNALDASLALPRCWLDLQPSVLENLRIDTWINGQCAHSYRATDWFSSAQAHLSAVSELIAWEKGDVLMLGCPPDAPLAQAGDSVETRLGSDVFTRSAIEQEAA